MHGTPQGWAQTGRYVSEATATSLQNCPQSRCRPSSLHSKWEEPQDSKSKHLFKESSQMVSGQLQWPTQLHRTQRKSERLSPTTRRDRNVVAGDWHPAGLRDGLPSTCSVARIALFCAPSGLPAAPNGSGHYSSAAVRKIPGEGSAWPDRVTHTPCGHQGDSKRGCAAAPGTHPVSTLRRCRLQPPVSSPPQNSWAWGHGFSLWKYLHLQINHTLLPFSEIRRKWLRPLGPPTKAICAWEGQNRPCRCR